MQETNEVRDRLVNEFAANYMEKLFYFCLKKTSSNAEAEDLTQDIALQVITALNKGTIPTSFSAYVWQIARNRYSVWAKEKHNRNESVTGSDIGDYEIPDESENILDEMIHAEQLALLRRELAFIKSDHRSIVVAHYIENRSMRAKEYAAQYRQYYSYYPNAGFGNMFAAWAKDPYSKNGHSYANGASMRVIPIGYAYDTLDQTLLQAKASCLATHDHREAIKGAQAVATAVFLARNGKRKDYIKEYLEKSFKYNLSISISSVKERHVFDSRTSYSVPPAIISFLESSDYESAIRTAISLGGDADTQACIAGGIAEAYYKQIPDHIRRFCDGRIDSSIKTVVKEFNLKYNVS